MRKVVTVASATAVLALALAASPGAAPRARFGRLPGRGTVPSFSPAAAAARGSVTVSVELAAPSATSPKAPTPSEPLTQLDAAAVARSQAAVVTKVEQLGGDVLYTLQHAANALVVRIDSGALGALASLDGVVRVLPSTTLSRASVTSNTYTGVSSAWQDLGTTGKGVKIGVIDDGVDYRHADFGGAAAASTHDGDDDDESDDNDDDRPGFPTRKVAGGWDLVGDAFDSSSSDPAKRVPKPDRDPMACQGHGTHVAGIAAGQGVTADGKPYTGPYTAEAVADLAIQPGAAPEATVFAYKVFGCDGDTTDAIVAAAIDRAVADDVDVIMMSIGTAFGAADSLTSIAANNAALAGVTVVASAGNDGPNAYMVAAPGVADRALSVAALDASRATFPAATIGVSPSLSAINANGAALTSVSGTLRVPLLANADPKGAAVITLGCAAADYATVKPGDIVVVRRGQCTRVAKARLAAAAGASAIVMVNTQAGLPPFEGDLPGVAIPFLGVTSSAGPILVAANGSAITVTAAPDLTNVGYGQAAPFSAGGPRLGDSGAKPDVSAPGVSVFSAAAGTGTAGINLSGTSAAAPQVAGVAALVRQRHRDWSVAQIKAAIMNTADGTNARIANLNTRVSGTGVVDGARTVSTAVLATTDDGTNALSFGYRPAKGAITATRSFTLENHSTDAITFDMAASFNGGKGADRGAELVIEPPTATVPAGGSVAVSVSISFSANAMAKLPPASQPAGQVVSVRGEITATPETATANAGSLLVPFLAVPRGLSDLTASLPSPLVKSADGKTATGTLQLTNAGLHSATADPYAWLLSDNTERDTPTSAADLANVGVQTFPGELLGSEVPDDQAIIVAVNTEGRWSTASTIEIDLPIDVDGDGTFDFTLVGADYGQVLNGEDNGQFASILFDKAGRIVNVFIADAPMNGSTALLPMLASDLGMNASNARPFTIRAQTVDRLSGAVDVINGKASWNPYGPAVSTADVVDVRGGTDGALPVTVTLAAQAAAPVKGWMIVTLDDRNGRAQADVVPLALPA